MSTNRRPSLLLENESFDIEVDFYENQQYRALYGGWTSNISSATTTIVGGIRFSPYSNLSGDTSLELKNLEEYPSLPPGWQWIEDRWHVDLPVQLSQSTNYPTMWGEVDEAGWSYGSSFENLAKQAQDRILKADRSALLIYRRRRWVRTRRCMDMDAKKLEAYRRKWVNKSCVTVESVMDIRSKFCQSFIDYHRKWSRSVSTVRMASDKMLEEITVQLQALSKKLHLLKTFFVDMAYLESSYASELSRYATKWMNAGKEVLTNNNVTNTSSAAAVVVDTQETSSNNSSEENSIDQPQVPPPRSLSPLPPAATAAERGFFSVVCEAQQSIAEEKKSFATLLTDSLLKDVLTILDECDCYITDVQKEGNRLREDMATIFLQSENVYQLFHENCNESIRKLAMERTILRESLHHIYITWDVLQLPMLPVINEELVDISCLYSLSPSQDTWMNLLLYNQFLVQMNSKMLIYHAFTKDYTKKLKRINSITSDFLKSMIKLLVHEHFKYYSEMLTMLSSIGIDANVVMQHRSIVEDSSVNLKQQQGGNVTDPRPLEPLKVTREMTPQQRRRSSVNRQHLEADGNTSNGTIGEQSQKEQEEQLMIVDQQSLLSENSVSSTTASTPSSKIFTLAFFQTIAYSTRIRFMFLAKPLMITPGSKNLVTASGENHWLLSTSEQDWQEAWIIVTHDRYLHLIQDTTSSSNNNKTPQDKEENIDIFKVLWNFLSSSIDEIKVFGSFGISSLASEIRPVYMTRSSLRNVFELKLVLPQTPVPEYLPNTSIISSASSHLLSSVMSSLTMKGYQDASSDHDRFLVKPLGVEPMMGKCVDAKVASVLFACESTEQLSDVIKVMQYPFASLQDVTPDQFMLQAFTNSC